jgi:glycosyltransferase involved in cell wall biosynthesis
MRIAYMLTSLGMGGAERQAVALAEWMAARGHSVLLIVLRERQPEEWPTTLDVVYLNVRKTPAGILRGLMRADRALAAFYPDFVHSHTYPANIFARLLRAVGSVPAVLTTVHNVFEGGPARTLAYRLTDSLALGTTAVSGAVAEQAVQSNAVAAHKCRVVSNAFDITHFSPDRARRAAMRTQLDAGDDFIWLAAGRIVAAKGYLTLLQAFAELWPLFPRTQLWIAGSRPATRSTRTWYNGLIVPSGTTERVRCLGLRRDMPALLDAADGFVLSSVWEGMPLVVGEAMAMEKPVVATDVGGVRELLADLGTIVPPRSPDALANAMLTVMGQSTEFRRVAGESARARISAHFSAAARFSEWEMLYTSLVA